MYKFLSWIAPSASAASFALFIFVPSLTGIDPVKQSYALHCFLFATPPLIASTFLIRNYLALEELSDRALDLCFLLCSVGMLSLALGFTLLLAAISIKLLSTFSVSFGISIMILQYAGNHKKP